MLPSPNTPRFTCPAAYMYVFMPQHAMSMPRILRGEADEAEYPGFQSTVVSPHRSLQTERDLVSNAEEVQYHRLCPHERGIASRTIRRRGCTHNQLPAV
jgi:hypothetical protein